MDEGETVAQMISSDSRSPALNDRRPGYRSSATSLSCAAVSARSQTTIRLAVAAVMRQLGDGQGGSSGDGGGDEVVRARCILSGGFTPPR